MKVDCTPPFPNIALVLGTVNMGIDMIAVFPEMVGNHFVPLQLC